MPMSCCYLKNAKRRKVGVLCLLPPGQCLTYCLPVPYGRMFRFVKGFLRARPGTARDAVHATLTTPRDIDNATPHRNTDTFTYPVVTRLLRHLGYIVARTPDGTARFAQQDAGVGFKCARVDCSPPRAQLMQVSDEIGGRIPQPILVHAVYVKNGHHALPVQSKDRLNHIKVQAHLPAVLQCQNHTSCLLVPINVQYHLNDI